MIKLAIRPADGKTIELVKTDAKWKLTQPVAWPADDYEARSLVDGVLGLRSRGSVDLGGAELSTTGLDKPRFTIEAIGLQGQDHQAGRGQPFVAGQRSVRQAGRSEGWRACRRRHACRQALTRGPTSSFRRCATSSWCGVSSFEVRQFRITHKGQTLSLQKEGENWKITEPKQVAADSTEVSSLLSTVTGLRPTTLSTRIRRRRLPPAWTDRR